VDRALPPERGLPSWGVVVAAAPKGYSTFFRNGLQHRTPDHFFSGPLIFFLIRFFKWRIICATISYRLHYGQSQTPVLEIIPDPCAYNALVSLRQIVSKLKPAHLISRACCGVTAGH
jgi:hypothetical protein